MLSVSSRPGKFRWIIGGLLFSIGMLNYIDRSAISVAAPLIKEDLHLDDAHLGIVFSSFFLGYAIFCFIGGYAADRFGPRRVFASAAAFWSLFCGLTAVVTGFGQLLVFRILFGVGEGPMGTTTNKSITQWFPRSEAGSAVGITNAGQPLGAAIAAPLVGLVAWNFGWRVSFVVIGILGVLWIIAWLYLFTDSPDQNSRVGRAEADLIENSRQQSPAAVKEDSSLGLKDYLFTRRVVGIAVAFFCFSYVLYFFLSWLPSYLVDYQHLDVGRMSLIGMIPWLGAAMGFVLGGVLSDWLFRITGRGIFSRKCILVFGLGVAAVSVWLAGNVETLTGAVALISLASFFLFMCPQMCWTLLQELVPARHVGGTGGFVHFVANLAGILAPSVTGFLVQYGGGYHAAFTMSGVAAVTGAVSALVLVRAPRRPKALAPQIQSHESIQ